MVLLMRANLVLNRKTIGTSEKFVETVEHLKELGVDAVSAWPIRGHDDKPHLKHSPLEEELSRMEAWVAENQSNECKLRLLREKSKVAYSSGKKLTLFPDGTLSNTWCN